jgi:hypothetical protein
LKNGICGTGGQGFHGYVGGENVILAQAIAGRKKIQLRSRGIRHDISVPSNLTQRIAKLLKVLKKMK